MPIYLDVAAVRIQSYLAHTPALWGRRGASAMLAGATSDERVQETVPGVEVNRAAGSADGTIHLVVPAGRDPADLALRLFTPLREQVPGAEFHAVWGEGPSYVEARRDVINPKLADGKVLASLPPVNEFPVVRWCYHCGVDPATRTVRLPEGREPACRDCKRRRQASLFRNRTKPGFTSEEALLAALGRTSENDRVEDFGELAALGHEWRNHLATIYIDGNAMGEFFRRLEGVDKDTVSRRVTEIAREALVAAAEQVDRRGRGEPVPVIPHLVGGDDVLVSVTAELAWPFVAVYLRHFAAEASALVDGVALTASAAVVFAHASHPFARCVEAADRLLSEAKRRDGGRSATVLWVDVTAEGEHPPGRRPWTLGELDARAADVDLLASREKSFRAALAAALHHPDDEVAAARALRLAQRMEAVDLVGRLLGPEKRDAQLARDAVALTRRWVPATWPAPEEVGR
ncbi:MAG: Cas10/Cmr2 second palm domain-containing protein [Egibacteraceae bacterium]